MQILTAVAASSGGPIRNDARLSGANADPEPANNPDAAQTPVAPILAPPDPDEPRPSALSPRESKQKKQRRAPRLVLTKRAAAATARPGAVIAYRITVANQGEGPARKVVVCDHPPAAQRTLRTEPPARGKGKHCWRLAKLGAGAERTFRLTAMVDPGSSRGTQRNRATVRAANAGGVRTATAAVRVGPPPQAACLARASRRTGLLAELEFLC